MDAEELCSALKDAASLSRKTIGQSSGLSSSDDEVDPMDHEDEDQNGRSFKEQRKAHYDEYLKIKELRWCCSVVDAELWGIFSGLTIAWERGFRQVILESDCKDAVAVVQAQPRVNGVLPMVPHIQELVRRDWIIHSRYVPRESNRVASGLAQLAWIMTEHFQRFSEPPAETESMFRLEEAACEA
ncbi:Detected protein of unknown function [Hibiscus syriacus]|uniref:RNase H type-1 domain-containing protein n=1 Tax=Hibiscus syriacus TaxID=106335 RepID=A0A6A2ZLG5_HIBSY|nr:Detected protein of unknown function [Hibiscus syriacus]